MSRAGLALAFGAVLGFVSIFLREIGLLFALAFAAVLIAFYVRQRRGGDAGWLLVGAGGVPLLLVGRPVLASLIGPGDVTVGLESYVAVAVAATVVVLGGLWVYAARRASPRPNDT